MQQGVDFLREFLPKIKGAEGDAKAEFVGMMDIVRGAFLRAAMTFHKELTSLQDQLGTAEINTLTVSGDLLVKELEKIKMSTPLGIVFLNSLTIKAKDSEDVQNFVKSFSDLVQQYGNKKLLVAHYNEHKVLYKKKDDLSTADLEGIYLKDLLADFGNLKALKNSVESAIDDPQYGPNVIKREKEEAKREKEEAKREVELKEAKAKVNEFQNAYEKWVLDQKEICTKIISSDKGTDSTILMDRSKFMAILVKESKVWEASQPEMTGELLNNIMGRLKKDKIAIKEFVNAMSAAVTEIKTAETTIASNWFRSKKFPEYFSLQTTIIANKSGYGEFDLMKEYLEWFAKVGAAADSLKLSASQQFIIQKLIDGINNEFKSKELEFFCAPFQAKLEQFKTSLNPDYCTLDELSYAWSESLYDVIMNTNTLNDSLHHLLDSNDEKLIAGISDILDGKAGIDTIQRVFMDSRRPPVKTKKLANGENIHTQFVFSDETDLNNTIETEIVKTEGTPCVVPVKVTANIASNKENGFEFEIKDLSSQTPIKNGSEGVSVYFEYKICFKRSRGSSSTGTEHTDEHGKEEGTEESLTDIALNHYSISNTTGGEIKPGKLPGLFVDGKLSTEFSVGYERESGTERSTGSSLVILSSESDSKSESTTTEKGNQEGYFLIKGVLYSHEIDMDGGTLDVKLSKTASPRFCNGLQIIVPNPENIIGLRWN